MYETRTGARRSVREIAERCPTDHDAVTVFEDFGRMLGDVLQCVTSGFHPATVIFGGAISRSAELFLPHTAERFPSAQLHVSTLFEDAALYGAASHWQHEVLMAGNH
jgi:predicted NBD/HSP70 family sugar kinase